jgi:hypothetical protein
MSSTQVEYPEQDNFCLQLSEVAITLQAPDYEDSPLNLEPIMECVDMKQSFEDQLVLPPITEEGFEMSSTTAQSEDFEVAQPESEESL